MPGVTRPQVARVVRELLHEHRFGPEELLPWLEDVQQPHERARRSHEKRRAADGATTGVPAYLLL